MSGGASSGASNSGVSAAVADRAVEFSASANSNFEFDVSALFTGGTGLSYQKTEGPGWAKLEGSKISGKAPAANKNWDVGVTASDSGGNSASVLFTIKTSKD